MPATFAESRLQVYTRDPTFVLLLLCRCFSVQLGFRYYGIIQAGYRAVLETVPNLFLEKPISGRSEEHGINLSTRNISGASSAPTPPATEAPSTPSRTLSRQASLTVTDPRTFSNNSFTTVDVGFVPPNPIKKRRLVVSEGLKGKKEGGSGGTVKDEESPTKKVKE